MTLYVGLMSGTSMDGIDAALLRLPSNRLELGITKKYSDAVLRRLEELVSSQQTSLASICELNTLIGREFANAVNELLREAKVSPNEVHAIGSHGQTVCHDTSKTIPYTLQLGCAHTISSLTGITVVADFRTRDIVNGGQGAPFAPLYHQELFAYHKEAVAVVNIGGIANCSLIIPGEQTQGWDLGPGNCLLDAWIYQHSGHLFDKDGLWAREGKVIPALLEELLSDSFIALPPPKSIGKEYYSLAWLQRFLKNEYKAVDVQATLLSFAAHAVAQGILKNTKHTIRHLYLCGGGTHNMMLRETMSQLLPEVLVQSSLDIGVNPDFLEAMMFAWLAAQTINKKALDLKAITGSKELAILGAIYQ